MMRPCLARWLPLLLVLLAGWAAPARAQLPADARFSYDLFEGASSSPVSGTLFYTPGTPLTVRVYLRQTAGDTEVLARDEGLVGGGVRLTYGASTTGVLNVASASDIAINIGDAPTQFNDGASANPTRQANANFAQFIATTDFSRGAMPTADDRVFLGTVTFQTSQSGGTTTLTLDDIPPTTDDVVTKRGFEFTPSYVLDPRVDALTLTVTPVPEPAAVLGVSAAVLGLTLLGSRRSGGRHCAEEDRCPGTPG